MAIDGIKIGDVSLDDGRVLELWSKDGQMIEWDISLCMSWVACTKFITHIPLSVWRSYRRRLEFRMRRVDDPTDEIVAVLVLVPLGRGWTEIGPILVRKDLRGKNYFWAGEEGRVSLAEIMLTEMLKRPHGRMFWCSHNEKFVTLARRLFKDTFQEVSLWRQPLPIYWRHLKLLHPESIWKKICYRFHPKEVDDEGDPVTKEVFAISH